MFPNKLNKFIQINFEKPINLDIEFFSRITFLESLFHSKKLVID